MMFKPPKFVLLEQERRQREAQREAQQEAQLQEPEHKSKADADGATDSDPLCIDELMTIWGSNPAARRASADDGCESLPRKRRNGEVGEDDESRSNKKRRSSLRKDVGKSRRRRSSEPKVSEFDDPTNRRQTLLENSSRSDSCDGHDLESVFAHFVPRGRTRRKDWDVELSEPEPEYTEEETKVNFPTVDEWMRREREKRLGSVVAPDGTVLSRKPPRPGFEGVTPRLLERFLEST